MNLLRLPHLPCIDIINLMSPTEQFAVSLCSRRSFSVVKSLRRCNPDTLHLDTYHNYVCVGNNDFNYDFEIGQYSEHSNQPKEKVTVNGCSVPCRWKYDNEKSTKIGTYWKESRVFATMKVIDHLSDLFKLEVSHMQIEHDWGIQLMEWVQQRQKTLISINVTSRDSEENAFEAENLKNIIINCQAKKIRLRGHCSEPFEIPNFHKKCDLFECNVGTWISLDNIMTMDCIEIRVYDKTFTSKEMNLFIKHWMSGGNSRLKVLKVTLSERDYNESELINGLNIRRNRVRNKLYEGFHYAIFEFPLFSFEVRRDDGVTASFQHTPRIFIFGVWPDAVGNT
uniref:FBA_2 domain-containing protein n=1 Tax=Caenorhabditis tropicalis TaxID=1561998 RepID=A0A1I7V208_9PELO